MKKIGTYLTMGAMALTLPLYSGCNVVRSSISRLDERLDNAKIYQVPGRLISGTKDVAFDLPEQMIPGADPDRPGKVVETIRDNKYLDIGTDIALGAGVGAIVGTNTGVAGASANSPEAVWRGIGIGAGSAAAARAASEIGE